MVVKRRYTARWGRLGDKAQAAPGGDGMDIFQSQFGHDESRAGFLESVCGQAFGITVVGANLLHMAENGSHRPFIVDITFILLRNDFFLV